MDLPQAISLRYSNYQNLLLVFRCFLSHFCFLITAFSEKCIVFTSFGRNLKITMLTRGFTFIWSQWALEQAIRYVMSLATDWMADPVGVIKGLS